MAKNREKYITERIKIEKFIPGGQALGQLASGKKIFLWNVLPGEIVCKCRITKEKSSYIEAVAMDVEGQSEHRIKPEDECYLATSPWQILSYDYELEQKHEILQEIMRQHQISRDDVPKVATDGKDFYYRNKMEYSLYYDHDTERIYPAFHERGSHRKAIVEGSSIEKPEIWNKVRTIIDGLNTKREDARKYQSVLLRSNQEGQVSGGLLENYRPHPNFELLQDEILGQTYSYSPNGFFQINLPVYEIALREIQKWIETDEVLDLYAGVGTIGLSIARERQLTLVECNESAFRELKHNCQGTKAKPILAKSEDALEYISPSITVIVDPPRAGCEIKLLEKILETKPRTVIYLSCNPATQGRDVKILMEKYQIKLVQPYNFFPRTPHLENLIILELKNGS